MEQNKIYHLDFLNNTLPDKCADLIIADPPYFEVKGEFDFIWSSFEEYLKDVEKWAIECKRILKDNGTLFWFGDAKKIAYSQLIFDKYFNLINSIVWENTNQHKQQIKFNDGLRSFAPLTERILMYSNDDGLDLILNDNNLFTEIRDYFEQERKKTNLTYKEINEKCFNSASNGGGMASNILTAYKKGWSFPTKERYESLQKIGICLIDYNYLKEKYDNLRLEYDKTRRFFNNINNFGDVIRFPNYETKKYNHETIKPEKLQSNLILTCTRENDLVIVPFAGSGTECAMALKEKRNFIGFEIDEKYVKTATNRVNEIIKNPTLF